MNNYEKYENSFQPTGPSLMFIDELQSTIDKNYPMDLLTKFYGNVNVRKFVIFKSFEINYYLSIDKWLMN